MEWILLSHLNSVFPPVIHSLLKSNVHFLMGTFSSGDIKEELMECEERCEFFLFQGFYLKKEDINKGLKIETKELSPGRTCVSPELTCKICFSEAFYF